MSQWGSAKARRVLAALLRIGWTEEIGPRMLARIAKKTGLTQRDL